MPTDLMLICERAGLNRKWSDSGNHGEGEKYEKKTQTKNKKQNKDQFLHLFYTITKKLFVGYNFLLAEQLFQVFLIVNSDNSKQVQHIDSDLQSWVQTLGSTNPLWCQSF